MVFRSKYKELRIIITPTRKREVNGEMYMQVGKTIEFKNNVYTTDDPEEIEMIANSKGYGYIFYSDERVADTPDDATVLAMNEKKAAAAGIGIECRECGFIAKNELGLMGHMKKHAK